MEQSLENGHFIGVLKVIEKLSDIIPAEKMYLGKKDFQQLKIIKDFLNLNKIKLKIIECKTIRDKNGLALSSRNKLLNQKDLVKAINIIKFVKNIKSKNYSIYKKVFIKQYLIKNKVNFDYVENINVKNIQKFK